MESGTSHRIETVELVDLAHGGEAVGRVDHEVVFVPYGIPGETATVEIVRQRKRYGHGRILEVKQASPDRVEPCCPYFGACGGCQLQHIQPERQATLKRQVVETVLRRIGGFAEPIVHPTIVAAAPYGYRNRARFAADREGRLGFRAAETNGFLPIDRCSIVHNRIGEVLTAMQGKAGGLNQLVVRVGCRTGALMVTPDVSSRTTAIPSGQQTLDEELLGRRFRLHELSFFQVNTLPVTQELPQEIALPWLAERRGVYSQADLLALTVLDKLALSGVEIVVDAYCGVGTFALLLAPQARRVIGIEEARYAVEDARLNARTQGVGNVTFVLGRAEQVLAQVDEHVDAVVLDPARAGVHPEVIVALLKLRPRTIVYVSCEPATLARDLKRFCEYAYRLVDVQPIDMFPQTYHVEAVAALRLR